MRSVADDLRDELQEEVLRLPFEERIALALQLGERGLEMFPSVARAYPAVATSLADDAPDHPS